MSGAYLLAKKDLLVLFRSPLAYIVLACFLMITGYFFAANVTMFQQFSIQAMRNPTIQDFTPQLFIIQPYLDSSSIILLFFLPLITMRSFSEEKKMGAFEMLMSYPLNELQIVGGKLLAVGAFLLVALILNAFGPGMLFFVTEPELLPLLTGYLGLFLLSMSFAGLGLFLSSLTENQIVAAALSFAALLLLWMLAWIKDMTPGDAGMILSALSPLSHFASFTKGVLDVQDITYYVTFIAGFCWLSVLSLENQRWRG